MNPSDPIRNRRIASVSALLSPQEVRERLPLAEAHAELVRGSRDTVAAILDGLMIDCSLSSVHAESMILALHSITRDAFRLPLNT